MNKKKDKIIRRKKRKKNKKLKKLDDLKNQDLKIIFEDITSHKREVKEIEDLTFQQLLNLQNKVSNAMISKTTPIRNFEEEETENEQKLEEREEEKKEEE